MPDPASPPPSSFSPQVLCQCLATLPKTFSYCVALSGGADSVALLHALAQSPPTSESAIAARAVHVDHGLHEDSGRWAEYCQSLCDSLGVSLEIVSVDVAAEGKGVEAAAREARYEAFRAVLKPGEMLLMAHHLDDQAETVLMNLFQGAGVAGLAGMPAVRRFSEGWLGRPLLNVTRKALRDYLASNDVGWVEDPSNSETGFDRNYLRHEVMPAVLGRWPRAEEGIARAAEYQQSLFAAQSEQAENDVLACIRRGGVLDLDRWCALPEIRQWPCLRLWLKQTPERLVLSQRQLQQLSADVIDARGDAAPAFRVGDTVLRRFNHALYADIETGPSVDLSKIEVYWEEGAGVHIPQIGFSADWNTIARFLPGDIPGASGTGRCVSLHLRFRRGGESIRLPGQAHHQRLKNFFQNQQIPPWRRGRIPLLFAGDQCLAVWGYAVADVAIWQQLRAGQPPEGAP
ncbi:MAG: tRNA lysidine(34) synthetase TilS [bacterium]